MAKKERSQEETNTNYSRIRIAHGDLDTIVANLTKEKASEMDGADVEYIEKEIRNCVRLISKYEKQKNTLK